MMVIFSVAALIIMLNNAFISILSRLLVMVLVLLSY